MKLEMKPGPPAPVLAGRPRRLWTVLRQNYRLLIPPTVLLILVLALCLFAVIYATNRSMGSQKDLMETTAKATADALKLQLTAVTGALYTMATCVRIQPDWNSLQEEFPTVAGYVYNELRSEKAQGLSGIVYLPFGIVSAVYPPNSSAQPTLGYDLFQPGASENLQIFNAVKRRSLTYSGPLQLKPGSVPSIVGRYPMFIQNVTEDEAWNHPYNMTNPSFCPPGLCYNATTGEKFWGFVATYLSADALFHGKGSRFDLLVSNNYAYRLTKTERDIRTGILEETIIAESGSFQDENSAQLDVQIPGADWKLQVYNPQIQDTLDTRNGLVALIVVAAFIVSGLLLLLLTSNTEAVLLLREQVATNDALETANDRLAEAKCVLETEKQQREALLERQLKLIACFDETGKKSSKQGTMDRIAEVRGHMTESKANFFSDCDIEMLELLGEGTFGKVHKGLWRSTVVAIKIMMLPASMSGAEKREKMVVWEAAISSSLTHPNIVQTYSYNIKPMKESVKQEESGETEVNGLGSAVQFCGSGTENNENGSKMDKSPRFLNNTSNQGTERIQQSIIHSFEVQLVLEFCDKGCLREALDQGVFMGPNGLNYPAILDCAIDVARAMLHLHCNNVLHMDLKARNVMLASSGTEGRGVSCKIADFGLAVRMENMETHMSEMFQGTFTHMAPEVLLEGRVSKAADVYAFGITLWELFTGGKPYQGIPRALLGHRVAKEGHRPSLPLVMPEGYRALLKKCWDQKPENRPSFAQVLEELQELRQAEAGPTPPMEPIILKAPRSSTGGKGEKRHKVSASKASEELKQIQEESSECLQSTNHAESVCLPNPPSHSANGQQDQPNRTTKQKGEVSSGHEAKGHGPADSQKVSP